MIYKKDSLECPCNMPCLCDSFDIQPCCEEFKNLLNKCNYRLWYEEQYREFVIRPVFSSTHNYPLTYCPCCGKKFPERLYDKWHEVLKNEYAITDPEDPEQKKRIPADFSFDIWWKKRGL